MRASGAAGAGEGGPAGTCGEVAGWRGVPVERRLVLGLTREVVPGDLGAGRGVDVVEEVVVGRRGR